MWLGVVATGLSIVALLYTGVVFSGPNGPTNIDQALSNVAIFDKILLGGALALGVSTAYLFWGESVMAACQFLGGLLLLFSPFILTTASVVDPSKGVPAGSSGTSPVTAALEALTHGGYVLLILSLLVLAADGYSRLRTRSQQGWKADQLRYGKGVKEEVDRHNVFLGKCWQLPFCRKFVRERCPIYHARRTCWRELTGCMCEEEVIRGAMENKPIPKDALMASTYIPRNTKLTDDQKRERCRSCVIYNEHQKHKYKMAMPLTLLGFVGIYILFHTPLIAVVSILITKLDAVVGKVTYVSGPKLDQPTMFQELLLACFFIVMLAYVMKLMEYLFFKLKV
jgi:hypothetical protein